MTVFDTNQTYTLADLGQVDFGTTPLAVLGHPIQHSISPAMHNAAIQKMRLKESRFNDWNYFRFDVPAEDLAQGLALLHQHNFLGLNLTIPHKVDALSLIDGISTDGKRMGAVNTLVWGELGYHGFNTDGYGLQCGLEQDLGVQLQGATVLLLGSGGAARAAAVQCVQQGCARLCVGNRSPARLSGLMAVISDLPTQAQVETFALSQLPTGLPETGILINATSLGLNPSDPAPIDTSALPSSWKVYDMIYNPPATQLLQQARAHGLAVAHGLSMLVHQGARALEIWSQAEVSSAAMHSAACHALQLTARYD